MKRGPSQAWILLLGSAIGSHGFSPQLVLHYPIATHLHVRRDSASSSEEDSPRHRPLRRRLEPADRDTSQNHVMDWGIIHFNSQPRFPRDPQEVSLAAWESVAATLYGKQRMDPNVASNARSQNIFDYRPVRKDHDRGRIGIELDGARSLFGRSRMTNPSANRRISLILASLLASGPWKGFETPEDVFSRPVAVYFNTIKQSLVASQELAVLKRVYSAESFDSVIIRTLGQDLEVPEHMCLKGKKASGRLKGEVDPKQGVIVIVQPSDFNDEFRPPGPAVDSVSHLQRLVARAAVENLPVVVVSPRFLTHQPSFTNNWEQSGYQQSSVFGGDEPAKGPTPWILRDFFPPAFVWVDDAVTLTGQPHEKGQYSRVSVMQSVMNEEHAWHLFGARQDRNSLAYQYLASTRTSAGRPTTAVMKFVASEWSF